MIKQGRHGYNTYQLYLAPTTPTAGSFQLESPFALLIIMSCRPGVPTAARSCSRLGIQAVSCQSDSTHSNFMPVTGMVHYLTLTVNRV